MRFLECADVAFQNLLTEKRMSVKIIIGLSTVILLLFCMGVYQQVFDRQMNDISVKNKKDCYLQETREIKSYKEYEKMKAEAFSRGKTLKTEEVGGFFSIGIADRKSKKAPDEIPYSQKAIHNAVLVVDGKRYQGVEDWRADIHPTNEYHKTDTVEVGLYDTGFTLFPRNVVSQYREETGREDCLTGELPSGEGEILISNYLLGKFGIDEEEQASLIGKQVSLYLGAAGDTAYCKNYTLSGIFDASVLKVREQRGFPKCMTQVLIHFTEEDAKKVVFVQVGGIRYYADNFEQLTDTYKEAVELSEKIDISMYGGIYAQLDRQISVINRILRFVIAGFVLAVSVYLISIFHFFFRHRQNYLVMLRAMGLRNSRLYGILFFEIFGLVFSSLIIGVYVSLYILFGLKYVYENAMTFPFLPDASVFWNSCFLAVGYCLILFLLSGAYHCYRLGRMSILDTQKTTL